MLWRDNAEGSPKIFSKSSVEGDDVFYLKNIKFRKTMKKSTIVIGLSALVAYGFVKLFDKLEVSAGIKNLIKWSSIVWKDRDWDFGYTYRILQEKIINQRKYFSRPDFIINKKDNDKIIKQLEFCERIIKRIIEDDYLHPEYSEYLSKEIELGKIFNQYKEVIRPDGVIVYERKFEITEEEQQEHDRLFKKNLNWETHWYQRDRKLLYKMFELYADTWWD